MDPLAILVAALAAGAILLIVLGLGLRITQLGAVGFAEHQLQVTPEFVRDEIARVREVIDRDYKVEGDLRREISVADQRKLDEYLNSVRDVEQRIENAGKRGELQGRVRSPGITAGLDEGADLRAGARDPAAFLRRLLEKLGCALQAVALLLGGAHAERRDPAEDVRTWPGRLVEAGARVLVFPSLYEGFGMPLLEGMEAGVPVVGVPVVDVSAALDFVLTQNP